MEEACPAMRTKPWMMLEWVKKALDISKKRYPDVTDQKMTSDFCTKMDRSHMPYEIAVASCMH